MALHNMRVMAVNLATIVYSTPTVTDAQLVLAERDLRHDPLAETQLDLHPAL